MGDSLVDALEANEHAAQVAARVAVIGVGFDGLLERLKRQLGFAHAVVRIADAYPRVGVARVQLHRTLEADDCLVELAECAVGDAQVVENGRVARCGLGQSSWDDASLRVKVTV